MPAVLVLVSDALVRRGLIGWLPLFGREHIRMDSRRNRGRQGTACVAAFPRNKGPGLG